MGMDLSLLYSITFSVAVLCVKEVVKRKYKTVLKAGGIDVNEYSNSRRS